MTAEFALMLRLAGAAATGRPIPPPGEDTDWDAVFRLAQGQQLLPLVCHGVRAQSLHSCPDVLPMVLAHCARTGGVIALLEEMNAAGIPCCVVKGFAAGVHYAAPEYRLSGDTDIVVDPADEDRACAFLAQRGFAIHPRWEHGHHAAAVHPQMGLIEVHVRLYDELVDQVWFRQVETEALLQEPKRRIQTPDGAYWTLGPTDHAIYMALHMVKHFILSGSSLRMMLDVALALADPRDTVDTDRLWRTMDALHYGPLLRSALWAVVLCCGLAPEELPGIGSCDGECVRLLLDDLEAGGWLGREEAQAREGGWHEYNRQLLMRRKSGWQYRLYMLNWGHSLRLSTLFPGKKRLARHYPAVQEHPVLIPLAWLHRLLFRGVPLLLSGAWARPIVRQGEALSPESRARLALFRRLDMIE